MAQNPSKKKAEVKRGQGTEQLPYGGAKQVNEMLPATPFSDLAPPVEDVEIGTDETGFDGLLYNPSDRPTEPITSGASFGPGPNAPNIPGLREGEYVRRVASELASSPGLTSKSKSFLARVARGL